MLSLNLPSIEATQCFLKCISNVRDEGFKGRLESIVSQIDQAAKEYEKLAATTEFYKFPVHSSVGVGGIVTKDEMVWVYDSKLVGKTGPGRPLYNKLRAAPSHGRCPLCNIRTVSTLDHYLPKSQYPVLAVLPSNLIPACKDCNTTKLDATVSSPESQSLHPYYDKIEGGVWLTGTVDQKPPGAVKFSVIPPDSWDDLTFQRVNYHFKLFGLVDLYGSQAANELTNINFRLVKLLQAGGPELVKSHLVEEAKSRRNAYLNSWQTAMYYALSQSDWFCSGGFQEP